MIDAAAEEGKNENKGVKPEGTMIFRPPLFGNIWLFPKATAGANQPE